MSSVPGPRDPHDEPLEHPAWENPATCPGTTASGDVVHAPLVPEFFRPADGAPALTVSPVRCDEVGDAGQRVHPQELVLGDEHGRAVTHLALEDVPRLCALLLALSRT